MLADAETKIRKLEKGPLQRFKNQNAVLKKYGEDGLKVYKAADGKKTVAQIAAETGVGEELAKEIAEWLVESGMAESEAEAAAEAASARKSKLREIVESESAPPAEPKKGTAKVAYLQVPEEEDEIIPITAGGAQKMAPQEQELAKPETMAKPKAPEPKPAPEEEEEIAPVPEKEEEIAPVEPEAAPPAEEKAEEEENKEEAPAHAEEDKEAPHGDEQEEAEEEELTPVEKTIKEKYGDVGLKVYALIDGQKTAEEIMSETGVSEAKLIEMLEYMEKQGIIKLEHPEAKAAEEAQEEKEKFAPLADQGSAAQAKEPNPVEVPSKLPIDMIKGFQIKTDIVLKFGEKGTKLLDAIDGKASEVDLSVKLGIPIYEVRDILSYFSAKGVVKTRQLSRNDVAKLYGDDCFAVYKKYGREGVLLYELIGKDMGIRQMAKMVTTQKDRFAEMFVFIHKVLGVDIPIDRDVIFAQLEGKK